MQIPEWVVLSRHWGKVGGWMPDAQGTGLPGKFITEVFIGGLGANTKLNLPAVSDQKLLKDLTLKKR